MGLFKSIRRAVKKVGKGIKGALSGATKTAWHAVKNVAQGDVSGLVHDAVADVANTLTAGYVDSKVSRIERSIERAEETAKATAAEQEKANRRQESQEMADMRRTHEFEADTSDVLEARTNPSEQGTLLTGVLGIPRERLNLGKNTLLGGGV